MDQEKLEGLVKLMFERLELIAAPLVISRISDYVNMLNQTLAVQRITGENTIEDIVNKQVYDSLYPLKLGLIYPAVKVLDLGTGGGLPGIPLKIYSTDLFICLVDANRRKIQFVKEASLQLGLDQIEAVAERAEVLGQSSEHREQYDCVVSKAVAAMSALVELTLPLVKTGGKVILYKGPRGAEEKNAARKALALCGGQITGEEDYRLLTGERRTLFIITKINSTPTKYPRTPGKPVKRPIK